MNYRKSLLSLAAVVALSSVGTSLLADDSAAYVPLTTSSNDNRWIMFGVNDFSTGLPSVSTTSPDAFTTTYSKVTEEDVTDKVVAPNAITINAATPLTYFEDSAGTAGMASYQALLDASSSAYFTSLEMALDTTSFTYSGTEPTRSMYISIAYGSGKTTPKIKLNYKASLEGSTGEIKFTLADGTTDNKKYVFTLNQEGTFANPVQAVKYVPAAQVVTDQTKPEDVLAYDLAKSPIVPSAYSKADHQNVNTNSEARFYHYNAKLAQWELWDKSLVAGVGNDFTEFTKGQAYWGKLDVDGGGASDAQTRAGLVLGKTSLSEANASVYTDQLTTGWNHISFDPASHRDIRRATTGIIFDTLIGGGQDIEILDETLNNSVSVTLVGNGAAAENDAKAINAAIDSAKVLGTVPESFNVRAYADTGASERLIILSDKKFTVKDNGADDLNVLHTIAKRDAINTATNAVIAFGTAVPATGVTSRYGEFSMVIEALTGTGGADATTSAAEIDFQEPNVAVDETTAQSAKVQFGTIAGDSVDGSSVVTPRSFEDPTNAEATTTLATAATEMAKDPVFENATPETHSGAITGIDTDFNGVNDMLLLGSTEQFYIRDNTYVRNYVFAQPTADQTITLDIGTPKDITVTSTDTAITLADKINVVAENGGTDDTQVFAIAADATHLTVVSAKDRTFDVIDSKSSVDVLKRDNSPTSTASYGAVKRVFDVAKLAREGVVHNSWSFTFSANPTGNAGVADDGFVVNAMPLTQAYSIDDSDLALNGGNANGSIDTATEYEHVINSLVTNMNLDMQAAGIAGHATHDYVSGDTTLLNVTVTVDGIGINAPTLTEDDTTLAINAANDANNAATPASGEINVDNAQVVADLKDEAVYTPDFADYGPLYTIKKAGFEIKSLLRPDTNLATDNITWAGVDVTRDSSDWFKDNEYNLFSVDNASGYWAYLAENNETTITLDNVTTSFTNKYHFLSDNTTDNMRNGQIDVDLSGLNLDTANVKLIVGGKDVKLTKEATGYSAKISTLETGLEANTTVNVALRATDGKGNFLYDASIATIDNQAPSTPSVTFNNGITTAFTANAVDSDVASFYLFKDFVADKGGVPVETALPVADASEYNLCSKADFSFGAAATTVSYDLLLLAVDGSGIFGKDNISNAKPFTYVNTIKGATVVSHTFGDDKSTAKVYDSACVEKTTNVNNGGVILETLTAGTVRISFISKGTQIDSTVDLPVTAFYKVSGTDAQIKVSSLAAYAGDYFFVQYGDKLYKGKFQTVSGGDNTFGSNNALTLTAVSSANQNLNP